jgi:hypothetical protein
MSIIIDVKDSNALIRRIGVGKVTVTGATVREAFKQADLLYPGFYSDVISDNRMRDSLQVAIRITRNYFHTIELDTPIPDGSEIIFVQQMVGG